jgi:hypothetical protein
MRLPSLLMLVSLFTALFGFQCGEGARQNTTKGRGDVVKFPDAWLQNAPGPEQYVITWPEFEVRRGVGALRGQLVFAAKALDGSYSRNYFAVTAGPRPEARPVTKQAWLRSRKLAGGARRLFPGLKEDLARAEFEYRGRKYAKAGRTWSSVVLSPGEKYLAVFSYTGTREPQPLVPSLGGGEPSEGELYWDVYEAATGKDVLSGSMPFKDLSPGILFSHTLWVDDDYLVIPLDSSGQRVLIGTLSS